MWKGPLLFWTLLRSFVTTMDTKEFLDLTTPLKSIGEGCGYERCPPVRPDALNVHIVPHTHAELGYDKWFEDHYTGENEFKYRTSPVNMKRILDAVVTELWEHEHRTFTFTDIPYFFYWWSKRDSTVRRMVYTLVRQGRFNFAGGGWGMNDEATTNYQMLIDSYTYGLRKLNATFRECGRPLVAWQSHVAGHSKEFTSLIALMGYDGLFISPISFDDELDRMGNASLEFIWRGNDDLGLESDIYTHKLFDGFNSPPGFCFSSLCSDPLVIVSDKTFSNVAERVSSFLTATMHRQSPYYRTQHILVMMGGASAYHDAQMWYRNVERLIEFTNSQAAEKALAVRAFFSSPACYLKAVHASNPILPIKQDDFMPHREDNASFATGLYTSRPTIKYMIAEANRYMQIAKQVQVLARLPANDKAFEELNWILGAMQDHSIISGASSQYVIDRYNHKLYLAVQRSTLVLKQAFNSIRGSSNTIIYYRCDFNISSCHNAYVQSFYIVVYNPLAWPVTIPVRLPVKSGRQLSITDPKGKDIQSYLMKIPDLIKNIPGRYPDATEEVVFLAEKLPPLGFRSYYCEAERPKVKTKRSIDDSLDGLGENFVFETFQTDAKQEHGTEDGNNEHIYQNQSRDVTSNMETVNPKEKNKGFTKSEFLIYYPEDIDSPTTENTTNNELDVNKKLNFSIANKVSTGYFNDGHELKYDILPISNKNTTVQIVVTNETNNSQVKDIINKDSFIALKEHFERDNSINIEGTTVNSNNNEQIRYQNKEKNKDNNTGYHDFYSDAALDKNDHEVLKLNKTRNNIFHDMSSKLDSTRENPTNILLEEKDLEVATKSNQTFTDNENSKYNNLSDKYDYIIFNKTSKSKVKRGYAPKVNNKNIFKEEETNMSTQNVNSVYVNINNSHLSSIEHNDHNENIKDKTQQIKNSTEVQKNIANMVKHISDNTTSETKKNLSEIMQINSEDEVCNNMRKQLRPKSREFNSRYATIYSSLCPEIPELHDEVTTTNSLMKGEENDTSIVESNIISLPESHLSTKNTTIEVQDVELEKVLNAYINKLSIPKIKKQKDYFKFKMPIQTAVNKTVPKFTETHASNYTEIIVTKAEKMNETQTNDFTEMTSEEPGTTTDIPSSTEDYQPSSVENVNYKFKNIEEETMWYKNLLRDPDLKYDATEFEKRKLYQKQRIKSKPYKKSYTKADREEIPNRSMFIANNFIDDNTIGLKSTDESQNGSNQYQVGNKLYNFNENNRIDIQNTENYMAKIRQENIEQSKLENGSNVYQPHPLFKRGDLWTDDPYLRKLAHLPKLKSDVENELTETDDETETEKPKWDPKLIPGYYLKQRKSRKNKPTLTTNKPRFTPLRTTEKPQRTTKKPLRSTTMRKIKFTHRKAHLQPLRTTKKPSIKSPKRLPLIVTATQKPIRNAIKKASSVEKPTRTSKPFFKDTITSNNDVVTVSDSDDENDDGNDDDFEIEIKKEKKKLPPIKSPTIQDKTARRAQKPLRKKPEYKESSQNFIESQYIRVTISPKSRRVVELNLSNGLQISLDIQFYFYESDDPVNTGREGIRPPGAQIFRALVNNPKPVKDRFSTKVYKSPVVQEFHITYSDWASLALRVYNNSPVVEVDWLVGPVPLPDDIGREVFIRYKTNLENNGVFFTDSNGRQTMKRIRSKRPTYEYQAKDNVAGNIYPVTSKISIRDIHKNIRFSVFNDRSQGGTSLNDGEIDMFLHRRILTVDDKQSNAILNETVGDEPITVRGTHYLYLTKANYKPNKLFEKKFVKEIALRPQILVSGRVPGNKRSLWLHFKNEFKGLRTKVPFGIHILTLERLSPGTLLIRLENYLQKNELINAKPKKVYLKRLFTNIAITSIRETTLAANQFLNEAWTPLLWKKETEFYTNYNSFYGTGESEYNDEEELRPLEDGNEMLREGILLQPQQIRSFIAQYEYDVGQ